MKKNPYTAFCHQDIWHNSLHERTNNNFHKILMIHRVPERRFELQFLINTTKVDSRYDVTLQIVRIKSVALSLISLAASADNIPQAFPRSTAAKVTYLLILCCFDF